MRWTASIIIGFVSACATHVPEREFVIAALPEQVPSPVANPSTPEKIALGKLLFWDPILSGERDVACATCHHPDFGYADGRAVAIGVGGRGLGPARTATEPAHMTDRGSMSILNVGFNGSGLDATGPESAAMFWDNREQSLEQQALLPIKHEHEMRGSRFSEEAILPEIEARLRAIPDYVAGFEAAFGPGAITQDNIARAIAAFERSLLNPSSFDRFMAGDDDALSQDAKRGLAIFLGDGCANCHSGPMLSDFELHTIGVPPRPGHEPDDGAGMGRFRAPSLRNITRTAPYMHDGSLATLEDVLFFYSTTVDVSLDDDFPASRFQPRSAETLLPFFESLGDGDFDREIPDTVPSGLPPGGNLTVK